MAVVAGLGMAAAARAAAVRTLVARLVAVKSAVARVAAARDVRG